MHKLNELNTLIKSRNVGTSIASRESVITGLNGEPRHIQKIDFASNKFDSPISPIISGKNSTDPLDLDTFSPQISGNLVDVKDGSMLNVFIEFSDYTTDELILTPIIYDYENPSNIVSILESKSFLQSYGFNKSNSSFMTPVLSWDVVGAWKIGLHVTDWDSAGGSITFNIYAWII